MSANGNAKQIPEMQAIIYMAEVLKTFKDNDERVRVLKGVTKYFGIEVNVAGQMPSRTDEPAREMDFGSFEDMVAAANAGTKRLAAWGAPVDAEREAVPVAAGWQ